MTFTKKILFGFLVLIVLLFGWFILIFLTEENTEGNFYNVEIPEHLSFDKPVESLTTQQMDSLEKIKVDKEKIVLIGDGYSGYDFYMWHKPMEEGEIYIKAFELTQNIQLSEWKLSNRTRNKISELDDSYKLYKGNTVIDEGTFEHFYPVRFELWFKSEGSGVERKLTEKNYVIDGWDR